MPGVTILPNSPGIGGFGSSQSSKWMSASDRSNRQTPLASVTHNGTPKLQEDLSVAEIKAKAKEAVQKEARGASALSLIRIARSQLSSAKNYENQGDLKSALASFIKTATLAKMTMDSQEFAQEQRGKGGVLRKELNDLLENEGKDLTARTNSVEDKLKAIERTQLQLQNGAEPSEGTVSKSGGSIADRLRALQNNGLSVTPSKRLSREVSNLPTSPSPPSRLPSNGQPSLPTILSTLMPSTPVTSAPSPHTFVPPSTLGPPSPSSSPSSSPQLNNNFDLTGFSQAFPSIDELDENIGLSLPSVPTGLGPGLNKSVPKDSRNSETSPTPLTSFRNFTVPPERPSSTPITPINNSFASRPASPTKNATPLKSSALSTGISSTNSAAIPSARTPLPVKNTAFPKELLSYSRDYKVLLIDVRNREDFDKEHIKADAVVCIEPSVLMRESVTAEVLEDSMVVAPKHEASLFGNRDKFDLVAVYDESSQSFGSADSSLSILVRLISEQAFRKMLKRMPMMLVGGIKSWKQELGDTAVVKGEPSSLFDASRTVSASNEVFASPPSQNLNHFKMNGSILSTSSGASSPSYDSHQVWTPALRSDATGLNGDSQHRSQFSLDQVSGHSRSPADTIYTGNHPPVSPPLNRRPAISRPSSNSVSFPRPAVDNITSPFTTPQSFINGSSSITYPQFPRRLSPTVSGSGSTPFLSHGTYDIASPPQASINPSQLSRRRSDFVDQSQEALLGFNSTRPSIDYPELSTQQILRPPPAVAPSALERQDRPRVQQSASPFSSSTGPQPPRIHSEYPVQYWQDLQVGTSGLKNLGNTCYMNAPIQCLSATVPFARFFTEGRWKSAVNYTNTLGSKGKLAGAFAKLLHEMWGGDLPYLTPIDFRKSICQLKSQYNGSDQHDSQEFLSFLIDGIHEDLNRIMVKPTWTLTPEQEAELEALPPQIASDREWRAWRGRNDSLIVDFFQGQFRNRLECLTCHKTSTTYNVFSILQLPIPYTRSGKVPIDRCLDALLNDEVLEKDDAWDCPQCKTKRRASKRLSLARLPPILLVSLKRFEANGRFSDKVDTFVDFPMKSLDLTNYMPPPLPPGADKSQLNGGLPMSPDDPQTQLPPYRYDLYGVTNHYGNLSSGHYTAFIASRGGWMYCDDSSVKSVDPKQVVNQKAYVLFYKRVRS